MQLLINHTINAGNPCLGKTLSKVECITKKSYGDLIFKTENPFVTQYYFLTQITFHRGYRIKYRAAPAENCYHIISTKLILLKWTSLNIQGIRYSRILKGNIVVMVEHCRVFCQSLYQLANSVSLAFVEHYEQLQSFLCNLLHEVTFTTKQRCSASSI